MNSNNLCICGKYGSFKCSRCKSKYYCSVECQKENWYDHKTQCSKLNFVADPSKNNVSTTTNNISILWNLGGKKAVENEIPYIKNGIYNLKKIACIPNIHNIQLLTARTVDDKEYLLPMKYENWAINCILLPSRGREFILFPAKVKFMDNSVNFIEDDNISIPHQMCNAQADLNEEWNKKFPIVSEEDRYITDREKSIDYFVERIQFAHNSMPKTTRPTQKDTTRIQLVSNMLLELHKDMEERGLLNEVEERIRKINIG